MEVENQVMMLRCGIKLDGPWYLRNTKLMVVVVLSMKLHILSIDFFRTTLILFGDALYFRSYIPLAVSHSFSGLSGRIGFLGAEFDGAETAPSLRLTPYLRTEIGHHRHSILLLLLHLCPRYAIPGDTYNP